MSEEKKEMIPEESSEEVRADEPEATEDAGESNAARRLRMLGISVEEEPPAEPVKKAGFFENFWYHYKFHTIAALFGIFVIVVGVLQLTGKTNPDIYIMYAGEKFYEDTTGITGAFVGAMPTDYNGDGKKAANILQLRSLSQAQKDEIKAQNDALADAYQDGAKAEVSYNESFLDEEKSRFREEIMVGESVIWIISPDLYKEINASDMLMPIEDVLGYKPSYAYDDYALKFKELSLLDYYSVFDTLPNDTLIVIKRVTAMTTIKGKKAEERHKNHIDYFKALVEFKEPYID